MNRIRELRKQKDLTMKDLGNQIGVSESTVSLYENEKRQPDQDTLLRIADYFQVSIDYLLGRTDVQCIAMQSDQVLNASVTDEEMALLGYFRSMNKEARERTIWIAKTLADSPSTQEGHIRKRAT